MIKSKLLLFMPTEVFLNYAEPEWPESLCDKAQMVSDSQKGGARCPFMPFDRESTAKQPESRTMYWVKRYPTPPHLTS